jgi:hypothetical protein
MIGYKIFQVKESDSLTDYLCAILVPGNLEVVLTECTKGGKLSLQS